MSDKQLRILVTGDVNGQFNALIKRLNAVNKKNGPFDMLFCVGEFFGANAEENRMVTSAQIEMPISTYILGPCCPSTSRCYPEDGTEFSSNLTFLGRKGLLSTAGGIQVAYLSGVEGNEGSPFQFVRDDVEQLLDSVKASTGFLGVDLLVTSMWPDQVSKFSTNSPSREVHGSCLISKLATGLRPRYHFAGMGVHYERTPYRNHRVLLEAAQHVTRFIGLSAVNNSDKEKWLYAFNIAPMRTMSRAELTAQPPNATEFPYMELIARFIIDDKQKKQNEARSEEQFFFDMSEEVEDLVDRGGKRRRRDENTPKEPKIQQPCWFCLSNVDAEQYLVVSVGNECYLAMPKGPLTDDHLMILSVGHVQSLVTASEQIRNEINKYKDALTLMFDKQGKVLISFERNYKTQHLQVQIVPIPKARSKALRSSFLNAAALHNIEMAFLKDNEEIWDVVSEGCPYFYVELPDGSRLYTQKMRNFPLQFGREVLCGAALLNCEEKVDWRECEIEKEKQIPLIEKLQTAFKPYDFSEVDDSD